MLLLLVPEFSLQMLPRILLVVGCIVLFVALLWFALSKAPPQIAEWAKWVVILIGGIVLLWYLVSLVG